MTEAERSPQILRQISIRSVMALLVGGAWSRSDLARQTQLSKQTMSDVIRTLEHSGWVKNIGTRSGGMGRSAMLYEIDRDAGAVMGLDIGASWLRIDLCDVLGRPLGQRELRTDSLSADRLMTDIVAIAADLQAECGQGRMLRQACLATPGVVNPETGHLSLAANVPALSGLDLARTLSQGLDCPAIVENDVNAAILGERWAGAARDTDFAAYVGLGTGVGLGLIAGGRLMRGATGAAGEVAHLPLGLDSLEPESLSRGTLERALGLRTTLAAYARPGQGTRATVEAFSAALDRREPEAEATLARIAELAAQLALSVQVMFDPGVIVLGGVMGLIPAVFAASEAELRRRAPRPARLVPAATGLRATVTGATYLALTAMYNQVFSPRLDGAAPTRWSLDQPWPIPPAAAPEPAGE